MPWFHHDSDEAKNAYTVLTEGEPHHKAALSHELIAAAASYEAAKAYQKHVKEQYENEGKPPPSHGEAKALIAGFAGAFVDRLVETKGFDAADKAKAKHKAEALAKDKVDEDGLPEY
ncbi:hypothetical protein K438DRAFT_2022812 [Mycena galopus ATCC 62051]|nr:hypothetical protein K438DRAFT_2022812 [Mycena galopus ATCC 62051]